MRKLVAFTPWLVALVALASLVFLGYWRSSVIAQNGPKDSISAQRSGGPGPAPVGAGSHSPVTLSVDGQVVIATTPDDCGRLDSSYFRDVCTALEAADWRAIAIDGSGPSPQMYARLLRGTLANDVSICSDDSVVAFVEAGSRVDASTATRYCLASIAKAWSDGQVSIYDPYAIDGRHPLIVVVK